jgi:hypothetical protein
VSVALFSVPRIADWQTGLGELLLAESGLVASLRLSHIAVVCSQAQSTCERKYRAIIRENFHIFSQVTGVFATI